MAEHTPGPWGLSRVLIQPASTRCRTVASPNGAAVAFANIWEDGEEEAEANARLIAAAPGMLKALEGNRELLDTWARPGNKVLMGAMRRVALAAAERTQAAIKAAGA